ncbi:MAG TPA: Gfo/Idh/MocA family oxidoreductase [Bacillota bacterium]|nr:Gfo/Idh/MocA family oxidoreductase [Bacillota bacterium]
MLKVAMLSSWHVHAGDYARDIKAMDNAKITVVWDEIPERGRWWAENLGVAFEKDLGTLLKRNDVDGVVVCGPTNMHADTMIAVADAGKHIFTEKVMALTVAECKSIAEAVGRNNVKFCISFPFRTFPTSLYAKYAIDQGMLGETTLLRIRNAHSGAIDDWLPPHFYDAQATGGGAMMDLGAHPMYLSRWLLGEPKSISSMFNSFTGKAVEDNAVSLIEFENKAIAIAETSFVSTNSPFTLELYGTEGTLLIGGSENTVRINSKKLSDVDEWTVVNDLPVDLPPALNQWVNAILNDGQIHFGLQDGIQLTQLMEGSYKSYKEGRRVDF